jgi:uncharacterized protein (DUF58 family)
MIVPRNRLLWCVAALGVPLATLGVAVSEAAWPALATLAALVAVAVRDAVGATSALAGVAVEVPEVVRLSKDRDGQIQMRIRNDRQTRRLLRVGLALPREFETAQEDLAVALPADTPWSRLTWGCRPRRRGRYRLQTCCLEAVSPLGLWAARRRQPLQTELRVYPNLLRDRAGLAALFLNRGNLGIHAQRQVGKGREFEKLRDYIPGDGLQDIHWKATAKRGHPVTKVLQVERTQEVYVVIDASRLSAREALDADATPSSALERFITAGLVLGLAAQRQGDLFGLLSFSDKVQGFVRAKSGKAHYDACRDALYTLEPRIVNPDFEDLFTFVRLRLRRRALLMFLTSLDDPVLAESFIRHIDLVGRQHLVLVNMLRPAGVGPLFAEGNVRTVDDIYERLGGHILWHHLLELQQVLKHRGVQFAQLDNEKLAVELVTQYLGVKQRQLL